MSREGDHDNSLITEDLRTRTHTHTHTHSHSMWERAGLFNLAKTKINKSTRIKLHFISSPSEMGEQGRRGGEKRRGGEIEEKEERRGEERWRGEEEKDRRRRRGGVEERRGKERRREGRGGEWNDGGCLKAKTKTQLP